jgi:IclR family acetate operon transcriptional repressor
MFEHAEQRSHGTTTDTASSSSVLRAFDVLSGIAESSDGRASLTQIAHHLGVSKSTAHRYLTTLEGLGVVERDVHESYRLGLRLVELAGAVLSEYDVRREAGAELESLAHNTKETAHLAVPSGSEVFYLSKVDSPHSLRMFSRIGARMPMYSTALGRSILAHSSVERLEEVLAQGLPARTPNTITDPQALRANLELVRERGFALDDEENEAGVRCVGAPIFDLAGAAVAAISVSGPTSRVTREVAFAIAPAVIQAARAVSLRLGYQDGR